MHKYNEQTYILRQNNDSNAYELIVAHTHLHKDHFEGDAQFEGRPHIPTIVGKSREETVQFYGFQIWPHDNSITYNSGGGRALSVLATPGHEDAEVSVWDPTRTTPVSCARAICWSYRDACTCATGTPFESASRA